MSGEKPFVHHAQISRPELLDVVDDEWMQDKLPDDGAMAGALEFRCHHIGRASVCCRGQSRLTFGGTNVVPQRVRSSTSAAQTCCMLLHTAGCPSQILQGLPADIPLPEGITPPTEEYDEMREEGGNALSKPARWTELGLASIH